MDLDQTQAIDWDQYEDSTDDELDSDTKPVAHLKVLCQRGFPETLFPIYQGDNLIGRSDTCNVHVPLTSLSKKHACIEVRGDTHFIYDCGSRNRTRRGEKMFLVPNQRYELQHGVKLYLADVSFEYIREEQPTPQVVDDSGSETGSESMLTGLTEEQQSHEDEPTLIPKTPAAPTLEQTRLYVEDSGSEGEGGGRKSANMSEFIVQDSQPTPKPGKLAIPLVFGTPGNEIDPDDPVQRSYAIMEDSEHDDDDKPLLDDTDIANAATQAYALNSSVDSVEDDADSLPDLAMEPTQAYVLNSSHDEDNFADVPTQAYGLDSDTYIEEGDDESTAPTQPTEENISQRIENKDKEATQMYSGDDVPTDEPTQALQDSIDKNEPTQTLGETLPFTTTDKEEPPPTLPAHPRDEVEPTLPVAALGDAGKVDEQPTLMIHSYVVTQRCEGNEGMDESELNKNTAGDSQGFRTSAQNSKPKTYQYDTDSDRSAFEEATQAYELEEEGIEREIIQKEEGTKEQQMDIAEEATQAYDTEDTLEPETQSTEEEEDMKYAGTSDTTLAHSSNDDDTVEETQAFGDSDSQQGKETDIAEMETQAYGSGEDTGKEKDTVTSTNVDDDFANMETQAYGEEEETDDLANAATQAYGLFHHDDEGAGPEADDVATAETLAYGGEDMVATQAYGMDTEAEPTLAYSSVDETEEESKDITEAPTMPYDDQLGETQACGVEEEEGSAEEEVVPETQEDAEDTDTPIPLPQLKSALHSPDQPRRQANRVAFTDRVQVSNNATGVPELHEENVELAAASGEELIDTQAYGLDEEQNGVIIYATEQGEPEEEVLPVGGASPGSRTKETKDSESEDAEETGSKKATQTRGSKKAQEKKTTPEVEEPHARRSTRGRRRDDSADSEPVDSSVPDKKPAEKAVRMGRGRRSAPVSTETTEGEAEEKPPRQAARRAGRIQRKEEEEESTSHESTKPKSRGRKSEPVPSTSKEEKIDVEGSGNENEDKDAETGVQDSTEESTTGKPTRKGRGRKSQQVPGSSAVESTCNAGGGRGRKRKDNDTESVASDITDDLEEGRTTRRSMRGKQREEVKAQQDEEQQSRRRTRGKTAKVNDKTKETLDEDNHTGVRSSERNGSGDAKAEEVESTESSAVDHAPTTRRIRGRKSTAASVASTRRGKATAVEESAEDDVQESKSESVGNAVPKIVVSDDAPGPSGRQTRKRKAAASEEGHSSKAGNNEAAEEVDETQQTRGKRGRQASKEETKETVVESSQPRGRGRNKTRSGQQNEDMGEVTLGTSSQASSVSESADPQDTATGRRRGRSGQKSAENRSLHPSGKKTPPDVPEVLSSPCRVTRLAVSGDSKPKIMFTGVVDKQGEKIVKDLGGDLVDSVNDCTHLVTDKVRRTVKFLCLLARGQLIVSTDWLDRCRDCRTFLDATPFMVKDPGTEKQYNFCLATSFEKARDMPMLEGYRLHVTAGVRPDPAQMNDIISCAGGEFLKTMPKAFVDRTVVVSCEADRKQCDPALKAGVPVVTAEFLLTGILRQEVDVEAHRLFADFDGSSNKRKSSAPAADTGKRSRRR